MNADIRRYAPMIERTDRSSDCLRAAMGGWLRFFLPALLLFAGLAHAAEPDLLEPDKAFRFSARLKDAGNVEIIYQVGSSRVDLQACKLEYSIVSPK